MLLVLTSSSDVHAQTRKGEKARLSKHRFSHIHGMRVENQDGEKLGDATDFIFNLSNGQLAYSLIQSRGFAGLRSTIKIVPANRLSSATIKKGVLLLDVGLRAWKHAPTFKREDLSKLENLNWSREIASYYSTPGRGSAALPPTGVTQSPSQPRPQSTRGDFRLATDLIGSKVFDSKNESLGTISDLLIDLSERKPPLAIVSTKSLFSTRASFATDLSDLSLRRNKLILDASPAQVAQAPFLSLRDWQAASVSNQIIYRFAE